MLKHCVFLKIKKKNLDTDCVDFMTITDYTAK